MKVRLRDNRQELRQGVRRLRTSVAVALCGATLGLQVQSVTLNPTELINPRPAMAQERSGEIMRGFTERFAKGESRLQEISALGPRTANLRSRQADLDAALSNAPTDSARTALEASMLDVLSKVNQIDRQRVDGLMSVIKDDLWEPLLGMGDALDRWSGDGPGYQTEARTTQRRMEPVLRAGSQVVGLVDQILLEIPNLPSTPQVQQARDELARQVLFYHNALEDDPEDARTLGATMLAMADRVAVLWGQLRVVRQELEEQRHLLKVYVAGEVVENTIGWVEGLSDGTSTIAAEIIANMRTQRETLLRHFGPESRNTKNRAANGPHQSIDEAALRRIRSGQAFDQPTTHEENRR